jgi:hypothetical protein
MEVDIAQQPFVRRVNGDIQIFAADKSRVNTNLPQLSDQYCFRTAW